MLAGEELRFGECGSFAFWGMANLRQLTNDELVENLKTLKGNEDHLLVSILEHIQEFENRKLFLEHGHPTLYSYLTKSLGYSENEAYRRIESARMLRTAPELTPLVEDGRLSLTALSEVRQAVRAQEKSSNEKMPKEKQVELAEAVVDCTKKEAQAVLAKKLPHYKPVTFEQKREITDGGMQITFRITKIQREKSDEARNLLANKGPVKNFAALHEGLCDFYLRKKDLAAQKSSSRSTQSFLSGQEAERNSMIPIPLKRLVLVRDHKQCQFKTKSGDICGSRYQIHIDHIVPLSRGGKTELSNLRCLCRAHNQWKSDKPVEEAYVKPEAPSEPQFPETEVPF